MIFQTQFYLVFLIISVYGFYENTGLYNQSYYDYLKAQQSLIDDVFEDYDPTVSPIFTRHSDGDDDTYDTQNSPNIWNYTVYLYYLKLVDVDEPSEKVSVVLELMEFWYDARLAWDSKMYHNITSFYVRQEKVWSPTLSAFGVNEIQDFRDQDFRMVSVVDIGFIFTYVSVKISVNCQLNMKKFPFDQQKCQVRLCVPIFFYKEVSVFNEVYSGIRTKDSFSKMGNSEWRVENLTGRIDVLHYNDTFSDLQLSVFEITIKRNPMYYFYMIILPSYIINAVSIIGIFLNSADKMSRLNVGLTNIMTMTFILGVMANEIPKTGAIPLLGIYIIVNLSIMIFSIMIISFFGQFRKWIEPRLRHPKLRKYVMGRPIEIIISSLLHLLNTANFVTMIVIWETS